MDKKFAFTALRRGRGFTLVEVLVALFLSGLVIAGLVGLWVSTTNFASSAKEELLWKNQLSTAARKMHKDVIEAVKVDNARSACKAGGTLFLKIYKNFNPAAGACMVDDPARKPSTVFYCFRSEDGVGMIYREEGFFKCNEIIDYECVCGPKSELLLKNLDAVPEVKLIDEINSIEITFSGLLTVGKNRRPVSIKTTKTIHAISGIGIGG